MSNSFMKNDALPLFYVGILMIFPYFFFYPTLLFPIQRIATYGEHFLFSFFILVMFISAYALNLKSGSKHFYTFTIDQLHGRYAVYLLIFLSVLAHLWLVLIGGSAYLGGGFISAREESLFNGIGIPLRLYLIAIPMLAVFESDHRFSNKVLYLFLFLVSFRALVLSERMAILEYAVAIWFYFRAANRHISFVKTIKYFFAVVLFFSFVQAVRLELQSFFDSNLAEVGDENPLNTFLIYYADVSNKFYGVVLADIKFYRTFWLESYEFFGGLSDYNIKLNDYNMIDLELGGRYFVRALNNFGGLAQDFSDFGLLGGVLVFSLKLFVFCYALEKSKKSVFFLAMIPILTISILEYPRFNYLYLPYGQALLILAFFFGLYVTGRIR